MDNPTHIPLFGPKPFVNEAHAAIAEEARSLALAGGGVPHDAQGAAAWLAASGLYSLLVPADRGGRAVPGVPEGRIDVRALCIVREVLGYVSPVADSIFAVQGLGSHAFVLSQRTTMGDEVLEKVAAGRTLSAFALTEPEAGSDVASMKTRAKRTDRGYVLDGEKVFISNVGIAKHYLVFANAAPELGKKGISCFLVPADAKGLTLSPMPLSGEHPFGKLVMNACEVSEGALVGEVGHGMRLALGTLDVFRTSVGAAACGMAHRAFDEALAHVRTRAQFGKALSEFQLTQAALAEMLTDLEAARLLVYRAAFAKDAGERGVQEVAMAKLFATEAAQRIIDRAVQLFGGRGVLLGSVVEQLYRDIRPLRIYEGTSEIQKLIIGGSLVGPS
ncbi:MAG: acyl-CoA dehydrogenase [Polyangiaceae bacterium]